MKRNNLINFELSNYKTGSIARSVTEFLTTSRKLALNDNLINELLSYWGSSTSDYKEIGTSYIGLGSQSSINTTYSYNDVYKIEKLDVAFGRTKAEVEELIKKHYRFKRGTLRFDWDNGVMFVNGKHTDVWD